MPTITLFTTEHRNAEIVDGEYTDSPEAESESFSFDPESGDTFAEWLAATLRSLPYLDWESFRSGQCRGYGSAEYWVAGRIGEDTLVSINAEYFATADFEIS